jgi:hypothetical protein
MRATTSIIVAPSHIFENYPLILTIPFDSLILSLDLPGIPSFGGGFFLLRGIVG